VYYTNRNTIHPFFYSNSPTDMKSQALHIKSTPVAQQLMPLRLKSPCFARLRQPRFAAAPLEGLESAPGTLPSSLLRTLRY